MSKRWQRLAAILAPSLLCVVTLSAAPTPTPVEYSDAQYHFSVTAPPGWELFPAEELPQDMAALFFQRGRDGEPTGATLSVRTYADQVHSDLDFAEFVGLYQLNVRSLGLESDQIVRKEIGTGAKQRIWLEYSLEEDGQIVWYKQMFYRVGDNDVLLLSAKDLYDRREQSVFEFNDFFDLVRIERGPEEAPTPEPLDLPTPKEY
jgi:hypothetical protein